MEEILDASKEYIKLIVDIFPRAEVQYATMTDCFVALADPVYDETGEATYLLEAYMGCDGAYEIVRNDAGMHDAEERFENVMRNWSQELKFLAQ